MEVFLVDDVTSTRLLLRRLLEQQGHVIVGEASNGEDACLEIAAAEPEAVLMDWRLPGMDGIETTRVLARVVPDIPVIAFVSVDDADVREGFLQAGASAFVHKEDIHGLVQALAARNGHP